MASRLFRLRPFCGGDRRCSRTRIAGCAPDRRVHLGTSGCFFAIGAPHKQAVAKLLSYPPCRDPGFRLASRTQMTLSNCCDCCGCSGAVADRRWWARTVSACRYQNGIKMNFSQGIVVAHGKPEGHPAGLVNVLDSQASGLWVQMDASCSVPSSLVRTRRGR